MSTSVYEYNILLDSSNSLQPLGRNVACFKFPLEYPLQLANGADYSIACSFLQMSMSNVLLPLKYHIRTPGSKGDIVHFQAGPSPDISSLLTHIAAQLKPHGIQLKMVHTVTAYDQIQADADNIDNVSISLSLAHVLGLGTHQTYFKPGQARTIKPSWLGVSPQPFLLIMEDLLGNSLTHTSIQPSFHSSSSNYIPYLNLLPQTNKNMSDNGPASPPYIYSPSHKDWRDMRKCQPNSLTVTLREGGANGEVLTINPIGFSLILQLHIKQRIMLVFS